MCREFIFLKFILGEWCLLIPLWNVCVCLCLNFCVCVFINFLVCYLFSPLCMSLICSSFFFVVVCFVRFYLFVSLSFVSSLALYYRVIYYIFCCLFICYGFKYLWVCSIVHLQCWDIYSIFIFISYFILFWFGVFLPTQFIVSLLLFLLLIIHVFLFIICIYVH